MQATFSTARSVFISGAGRGISVPTGRKGRRGPWFLLLSLRSCAPTRYEIKKSEDKRVDYGAQLGAVWNRLKTAIRSRPITTH
jgi:hypothetical protein